MLNDDQKLLTNCNVVRFIYSSGGHESFLQWNILLVTMSTNYFYTYLLSQPLQKHKLKPNQYIYMYLYQQNTHSNS